MALITRMRFWPILPHMRHHPLHFLDADVHIQHIKMCAKWIVCSMGIFKTRQKFCAAKPVLGSRLEEGI